MDGRPEAPIFAYECPVLSLTPENRKWLALFRQTHRLKHDGFTGLTRYERQFLPTAGGIWEQPALALEVLDHIESVAMAVLYEQRKAKA